MKSMQLFQLEISDPNTYTVDMVPLGILPMGENKLVEITKKVRSHYCSVIQYLVCDVFDSLPLFFFAGWWW